jgi:lipopolysaccharide transport system permease protein
MIEKQAERWDIIIDAKKNKLTFNFTELLRYRDLILQFAKRDITTVYNQTILGPLWFLIQPLLTTVLFLVVFGGIAKISTGTIPGALFYLSGLTIWNYFTTNFSATANTFVANSAIFGKVYFPRLVTPLSKAISGLFVFGAQFILFLGFLSYYIVFKGFSFHLSPFLLLIPYLMVVMSGLGIGMGIIISSLTTKYRDLSYLVGFGLQLLMYLTPVIYPISLVKGKMRLLILANPMSSVIEDFKYAFFHEGPFHWLHLAYSSVFMIIILLAGILLFNRIERDFMDTV